MGKDGGILVISLDVELFWGVHDVLDKQVYKDNILGVHQVIPALLKLFGTYQIHATWAIVGMLYFNNDQELNVNLPKVKPEYIKRELSPYFYLKHNHLNHAEHPLFFAPKLIEHIRDTPGQEVASHTFSHYYCLEKGQTEKQFIADIQQFKKINQQRGMHTKTIVFPRNQINQAYLSICKQLGFTAYRGNEKGWIYQLKGNDRKHFLKRGLRLLDTYFNLSGHQTYSVQQIDSAIPVNVPSSRMLKPVSSLLKGLEGKRLKRILNDMTYAAKQGEIYHLWWHPHNFGADIEENLSFLKKILAHYTHLQNLYGFKSKSMGEVTSGVLDCTQNTAVLSIQTSGVIR